MQQHTDTKASHLKAGTARAAIDQQDTYREHLHRRIASPAEDVEAYRRVVATEYEEAKASAREACVKLEEAKRALACAKQTAAASRQFIEQSLWQKLNNDVCHWSNEVMIRNGKCGALRDALRSRGARRLPDWFMDCARFMLEPAQFQAIEDAAIEKSRQAKDARKRM